MTITDKDLLSIQEARRLVERAYEAQKIWGKATQEEVDRVCQAMAEAAYAASERLGRNAAEETGFGVPEHKKLKNEFASKHVWESIKDIKTVGVINHDVARKIYEIAWPVGVVAGLVPSTNPTSTAINKILISVKARNAIVLAPHPFAVKCTTDTAHLMAAAAEQAGAPAGLINALSKISLQGTQELMGHKRVALILATGGGPMVRVAHSMGKPAYGVGPGNVPAYVDRSADLEKAAKYIVSSKAFDFSTICATEQAVVADRPIAARLMQLMQAEGAFFVDEAQAEALRKILFHPDGEINAAATGKSPQYLAAMAGFEVPNTARILVARVNKVGHDEPLSREKLTTALAWYEVDGWEDGCDISLSLINFGGRGHSLMIHAQDEKVIMAFGLEKPVFRIGVNTMGTLGAIGLTTGVMPSLTLGSGGIGGAITGDNVNVHHLYNVKRLAYETSAPPEAALRPGSVPAGDVNADPQLLAKMVEEVVREVLNVQ
ncbi:MAG: aldehyde dehydrogenase family protein [Anaerolineales bacterium]|uniref:Aldehyde dehydrogenase family protein n=1 Tax=Candidatus Desulfolinea nitratireducens TaxID=2841698 RepID=A0A8J6NMP1_9CHLR|nr:aldehyde dehydrogenase family protein [Candidatus Desulfolinea nitratireducens]MBL6961428.1 aldehyde dehydrogenase family protein [Anaerolineales bacterium]